MISTLKFLSERGYVWGVTGTSLTEDNISEERLICNVKKELIYICVSGNVKNGVSYIKHSFLYKCDDIKAVEIDFKEDKDKNMNMTVIKKVKAKDFDSAAFRCKEFRIVIRSPKSVPKTLKFLHENGFMWGCSKTSLIEDVHMREWLLRSTQHNPVFIIADGDTRYGILRNIMSSSYIPTVELDFEETSNDKIVITNNGKITTATLYSDGKKAGIGTAVCHDDDEFDIYAGARLALERLEKSKKKPEMTDWEKFVKGTVNMRIPKKYIRSFLERAVKDDLRIWGTMADWCLRCFEQDGDSIVVFVDYISKNYIILVETLQRPWSKTVDYFPGMK